MSGLLDKSRSVVASMFDRISSRYDLLNRVLSAGLDRRWRQRLAKHLPDRSGLTVLDVATGTADILLTLFSHTKSDRISKGIGVDISEGMLEKGREKVARSAYADHIHLEVGDATDLKLADASVDVVSIAFGIRNVSSVESALSEFFRVLSPEGRLLILEFSLPENCLLRWGYLFYFRYILPTVGGLISGDFKAYRYLNRSVESFPYGAVFEAILRDVGFKNVVGYRLCGGIATIYQADR